METNGENHQSSDQTPSDDKETPMDQDSLIPKPEPIPVPQNPDPIDLSLFNAFISSLEGIITRISHTLQPELRDDLSITNDLASSCAASMTGFGMPKEIDAEAKKDVDALMDSYRDLDVHYARLQAKLEKEKPEYLLQEKICEKLSVA